MNILLKNANIIHHSAKIEYNKDILIQDKIILAVGDNLSGENAKIVDCTDKFITPGFVNMHAHSPMNIFKGIAEDVNIDDWFNKQLWPFESKMQDEDIYYGSLLAMCEMINNGITAFADHYFKSDIIARAAKEIGIKADIAYTIFGFGGDAKEELFLAETFYNNFKNDELIRPRLGPHSPYICSLEVLKEINEKAKSLNCGIHIHISETAQQVSQSLKMYNKTPFEVVYDSGGFNLDCIVGHGLHITKADLKFINEKTCISVSPKTYTKLGMSKDSLFSLKNSLNIVSGTDGAASSNSLDVLEQMRMFALLGKWEDNAEDFTLNEIWKILMNGHNYLKFNSGKIQKGYSADLNIFDLTTVLTAPVYSPIAAIIYSSQSSVNITDVLVNGQFVKENGNLNFDYKAVIENAKRCSKEILERGRGETDLSF